MKKYLVHAATGRIVDLHPVVRLWQGMTVLVSDIDVDTNSCAISFAEKKKRVDVVSIGCYFKELSPI